MRIDDRDGIRVLLLDADGPAISTSEDTSDLIGNAWMEHAQVIGAPAARLDPAFFTLETRLAGEITQKTVNYGLTLAVLGGIDEHLAASSALRDYVWESNRGEHVWFLADEAALEARLAPRREAERMRAAETKDESDSD